MYAVIDLGGTNTSIVTFASLAVPQYTLVAQFPTDQDYARQLERILAALDRSGHQLEGVGMAIGAQLTPDGLAIEESWTMQAYVGHSIVSDVASATGVAVRAANDNVCGVLAETTLGVLQPWQRSAYLTVSTGTGAGIRLGKGNGSIAWLAQVGHHVVHMDGEPCVCGQRGCVQTITGGQQFLRRYGKPAAEIHDEAVWQEVTETLAIAIVNLSRIARVDAVCVSGGIGYNNTHIRARLAARVRALGPATGVRVCFPAFGEQAPVIGAALLLAEPDVTILH